MTRIIVAATTVALLSQVSSALDVVPHERRQTWWPNGRLRSEVSLRGDVYDGDYRTWYASGRPYELRHFSRGREAGRQQSWTEDGQVYLNYEVRGGRRFGLVNASPCVTVEHAEQPEKPQTSLSEYPTPGGRPAPRSPSSRSSLPFYDAADFTPRWSPAEHRVAPFTLTRQDGTAVSERDLDGRIHVASFLFTRCAAVCPILVRHLARVQAAISSRKDVVIVSYSVTPDTDTPGALAAFGRAHGIDPTHWWLVTGDRTQIYRLARTSYFADDDRVGRTDRPVIDFLHTEKLLLVDGERRLRGIYNGTQPFAVDQLIEDLARLKPSVSRHATAAVRRGSNRARP